MGGFALTGKIKIFPYVKVHWANPPNEKVSLLISNFASAYYTNLKFSLVSIFIWRVNNFKLFSKPSEFSFRFGCGGTRGCAFFGAATYA